MESKAFCCFFFVAQMSNLTKGWPLLLILFGANDSDSQGHPKMVVQ